MERLKGYFTDGIASRTLETVGAEVETQFVDCFGQPITTEVSQAILKRLVSRRWEVVDRKGALVTGIADRNGNRILYELGRHNLEVATRAVASDRVFSSVGECLAQLYEAAEENKAKPYFAPVLESDEDLLVVPDERDATWIKLDGRAALLPLARTSAVHFTVSVAPSDAANLLTRFGRETDSFLADFPQDAVWRRYITESAAGYRPDRYGGPLFFDSLDEYCRALVQHDVVDGVHLAPFFEVVDINIPLFLRSVWWFFRLKRYGDVLCLEIRPIPRRADAEIRRQLETALDIFG